MRRRASTAPCRCAAKRRWAEGRLYDSALQLIELPSNGRDTDADNPEAAPLTRVQEEAEALTSQLAAAAAQLEQARAEIGDAYTQWERDQGELVEEIRWVGGRPCVRGPGMPAPAPPLPPNQPTTHAHTRLIGQNRGEWGVDEIGQALSQPC